MQNILRLGVVVLLLGGCGHQSTLTAMEQQAQHDCQTRPPDAYDACLEQATEPHSEYESDRTPLRADLVEGDDPPDETLAAPVEDRPVMR